MSITEPPSGKGGGGGGGGSLPEKSEGGGMGGLPAPVRPPIRPQHVYAPQAPLGMVTLGIFGGKKKKTSQNDLSKITTGL